jgi:uncharacterized membrane protein
VAKPPAKSPENKDKPLSDQDDFASEIAKRIGNLVGRDQAPQITAQIVALVSEKFSGPIAHPRHLREYEDIVPGAADRIIRMAEDQLLHQRNMDEQALKAEIADTNAGRWFGFIALLCLIGAALVCAWIGQVWLAGLFIGAGALGTISVLVRGKNGNGR